MFSQDLKELRFDPTVIPAEFALASLKLRRSGKIDAARQLFFAGWRAQTTWLSKMRFLLGGIARALVRGARKSDVSGRSVSCRVDLGDRSIIKNKIKPIDAGVQHR